MRIELNMLASIRPRKAQNTVYEGKIVKYQPCEYLENNGVIWIEDVAGNIYKFFEGYDDIEIKEDATSKNIYELEKFIEANRDGFRGVDGFGEKEILTYYLSGLSYELIVSADEFGFYCETIHNGRKLIECAPWEDSLEKATANARRFKTMRGVRGFIERYAD